ncbi:ParB/RepB/Spo0J family partition protein [Streptomyces chartreusis]|uniref:ParB/RepB/Spo0J family partition protein n=1 Tax=Streptomyces chartreusis TaxID=1969 RepID=UPI003433C848
MVAKKKDWAELLGGPKTGDDTEGGGQPAAPPVTVFMHTIVGNPDNPRPEADYSDDDPEFGELKASMREIGQLQPLAVVSRTVFEQAKPDAVAKSPARTRKLLKDADWVVVTGNRRLAAARQLGWTRIDIRVQDQLGDEDGRIDEAVIIENIHRKNLAPIKEAEYLAGMLERHGSQEKVAERIGKSQVYVSQRLALLRLAPDLQNEVDAGTLKIKEARQLAGKSTDHAEQRAQAAALKARAAEPKPSRSRLEEPVQNPVLKPTPDRVPEPAEPPAQNTVLNGTSRAAADPGRDSVPEPREEAPTPPPAVAGERKPVMFPYDDGTFAARLLIERMPAEEFEKLAEQVIAHRAQLRATAG